METFTRRSFCAFLLAASSTIAKADDWGCTVLLCLANPAGPMAVAQCVPPIQRLWSHLAKGRVFPSCEGAGNSGAAMQWALPELCPPHLLRTIEKEQGTDYWCAAMGVIDVTITGQAFARHWFGISDYSEVVFYAHGEGVYSELMPAGAAAAGSITYTESPPRPRNPLYTDDQQRICDLYGECPGPPPPKPVTPLPVAPAPGVADPLAEPAPPPCGLNAQREYWCTEWGPKPVYAPCPPNQQFCTPQLAPTPEPTYPPVVCTSTTCTPGK